MDNYPDNLAPAFDEQGGVETPFVEWWARVSCHFPYVPEEVARDWLHRHWRHSPFSHLKSANYRFSRKRWPANDLPLIRSRWNDFAEDASALIDHGEFLAEDFRLRFGYDLAEYMLANGNFPVPPVVLDNRDGHLEEAIPVPPALILIEGHRRFNIATYLSSRGRLNEHVDIWLMTEAVSIL